MFEFLWLFFVLCLSGGFFAVLAGFSKFSDPFKSKNWFFIGGVSFLIPMVITLIMITAYQSKLPSSPLEYDSNISYGFIFFEIILIAVLLFGRFGVAEDRVARNTSLVCVIIPFIQLLILLFFFTMMLAFM